jgi:hypothetical protein
MRAERCIKDGRFSYPPDLQEKVDAYRRARKLSPLIQDAIRRPRGLRRSEDEGGARVI